MEILLDYSYGEEMLATVPVADLCRFVLEEEELPENTEVSVSFVDNEEIAALNSQYRGKQGPTDVLSFECDMDEDDDFFADADDPIFSLGDVIIAPDVALAQTATFGSTFEQEVSLLLVHGLLHLCGYDHIEDDEAEEMQAREKAILGKWFTLRGAAEELRFHPVEYVGEEPEFVENIVHERGPEH